MNFKLALAFFFALVAAVMARELQQAPPTVCGWIISHYRIRAGSGGLLARRRPKMKHGIMLDRLVSFPRRKPAVWWIEGSSRA